MKRRESVLYYLGAKILFTPYGTIIVDAVSIDTRHVWFRYVGNPTRFFLAVETVAGYPISTEVSTDA